MDIAERHRKKIELGQLQTRSADEIARGLAHREQSMHRNDALPPEGMQRVRVDGGDSSTPQEDRKYVAVKAGYGVGLRAARALARSKKR